ncbi:MAG: sugar transferase [Desulfobacterales bacterium]|nr:MAG: sugar transferase [Desulfobacterales bacterium]
MTLHKKLRIKYLFDHILAWILLIVLGPLILLIAFLIKLEGFLKPKHSGPAFHREPRISEGRAIQMLKFRTVTTSHVRWIREKPESRSRSYPTKNRTRLGKIIMNSYLDEIPQLWNIAKGEMFFVGARPDSIEMHERTLQDGFTYRNHLKGGLLGITQACKSNERHQLFFKELARQHTDRREFPQMLDEFYLKSGKPRPEGRGGFTSRILKIMGSCTT